MSGPEKRRTDPDQREIARATAEIRRGWSDHMAKQRWQLARSEPWRLPVVVLSQLVAEESE